jgi:hypothetical protein
MNFNEIRKLVPLPPGRFYKRAGKPINPGWQSD